MRLLRSTAVIEGWGGVSVDEPRTAEIRMPMWVLTLGGIFLPLILGYVWGAGGKSASLDQLLADTHAMQGKLSEVQKSMDTLTAASVENTTQQHEFERRLTVLEGLVEQNRQRMEDLSRRR